jgi:thiol-disulfide isomerase/thioredoxin
VRKRNWLIVVACLGVVAIAAAIGAVAGLYTIGAADAPPVGGSVQNFTVETAGVPAPATPIEAADGGMATLADYRGRLVVLNFWATWCGPCVRELPSLQRLAESLPENTARVVLISQDRGGFVQIDPFLDRLGIDIADSYVDNRLALSRAAGVTALPTTILIGPDGDELGRLAGHAEWDTPEALALIRHYLD